MLDKLQSHEAVAAAVMIFSESICPKLDDPEGCKKGVAAWWPKIAEVIFAKDVVPIICKTISDGTCQHFK